MAALSDLLSTLTASLQTASSSFPEPSSHLPPAAGISLLDTKNELLLSYLQNLVFLIILKIRNTNNDADQQNVSQDQVVQRLNELRIYVEKGVRPLENKLKYQIEKTIRAAEDVERQVAMNAAKTAKDKTTTNGTNGASDSETSDEEEDEMPSATPLNARPNIASIARPAQQQNPKDARRDGAKTGAYKPPRITPTTMPTTTSRTAREARTPRKSATVDEFVASELSSAPLAEPSIGSTIENRGRSTKSVKDRETESERRTYEESNFVRLPKESREERKRKGGGRERGGAGYGGEEWRGLGDAGERIANLTRRDKTGRGVVDGGRKRKAIDGGGGGMGSGIGDAVEKRRRILDGRKGKGR